MYCCCSCSYALVVCTAGDSPAPCKAPVHIDLLFLLEVFSMLNMERRSGCVSSRVQTVNACTAQGDRQACACVWVLHISEHCCTTQYLFIELSTGQYELYVTMPTATCSYGQIKLSAVVRVQHGQLVMGSTLPIVWKTTPQLLHHCSSLRPPSQLPLLLLVVAIT